MPSSFPLLPLIRNLPNPEPAPRRDVPLAALGQYILDHRRDELLRTFTIPLPPSSAPTPRVALPPSEHDLISGAESPLMVLARSFKFPRLPPVECPIGVPIPHRSCRRKGGAQFHLQTLALPQTSRALPLCAPSVPDLVLPASAYSDISCAVGNSWSTATLSNYRTGLNQFKTFCD